MTVVVLVKRVPGLYAECSTSCPDLVHRKLAEGYRPKGAEDRKALKEMGYAEAS